MKELTKEEDALEEDFCNWTADWIKYDIETNFERFR